MKKTILIAMAILMASSLLSEIFATGRLGKVTAFGYEVSSNAVWFENAATGSSRFYIYASTVGDKQFDRLISILMASTTTGASIWFNDADPSATLGLFSQ
jgi:hypothetical protein